jgi:hypothetical protein
MSPLTINIEDSTMELLAKEAKELNIDVAELVSKRVNALYIEEEMDAFRTRLARYAKDAGLTTEDQIFEAVS